MRRPAPPSRSRTTRHLVATAVMLGGAGSVWAQSYTAPPGRGGGGIADNMAQVVLWCGVLLVAAVVLAVAFFLLRKHLSSLDDDTPAAVNPLGFTLSDLRQMHDAGQISDQEFDLAKRKMLARAKAQLDPDRGIEVEFEDVGDLTEATQAPPVSDNLSPTSPDKDTPADCPAEDDPADKNGDADDQPPPNDPPRPPKLW